MTRSQRLHPVVQHTDKKEQRALQEVAVSLEKKKYDIGVFTPHELQEFNRFLQQLDQTIERQIEVVELRQQELSQKRQLWNAMRIDSKKMHKVVEKLQQQEFVEQERKEQKDLDEFAQRKFNRR
jgi:flagellar export protein FliJ